MVFCLDCKKCSYFEGKREITNSGKVVVGFCKLRNKHISDLNIRKEFCKDRATVDIPAGAETVAIKPEPSLYTDREKEMLSKAAQKSASQSSRTFAQLAQQQAALEKKKSAKPEKVPIIPPMKLSPEDAIRLLEQQQRGEIKAKFSKPGNDAATDAEREIIRKTVWGGTQRY